MKKKSLIILLAFVLVLAALFLVWAVNRPAASEGQKAIILEVVHGDGTARSFPMRQMRKIYAELWSRWTV